MENMKEYEGNMTLYEEIRQKYEGICQYIRFGTLISIWVLGLGEILSTALI